MPAPIAIRNTPAARGAGLIAGLDGLLPDPVRVGGGSVIAVSGWCFHPQFPIDRLTIEFDGVETPVEIARVQRRDLVKRFGPAAEWSGFTALVPIAADPPNDLELNVNARLRDGSTTATRLAHLRPNRKPTPPELVRGSAVRASIAVCMTTYNPRPDLFARQIASLREQRDSEWTCVVCDDCSTPESFAAIRATLGDDPRFGLYRQRENTGFYHNFEQCLALSPTDAEFVALSDQDDVWHPEKLAALRAGFRPGVNLVYCDARIVSDDGRVLAPTYWTTRRPNRGDFGSLLIANTVTGAAAMLRRELLDVVLPFPPKFGAAFHDHWLACAALAVGDIAYIDRPLYDYVQHGRNVIGHFAPAVLPLWTRAWRWCKFFWPFKVAANIRELLGDGRSQYADNLLRVWQLARTLELRCGVRIAAEKRKALRRTGRPLDLLLRGIRFPGGVSPTVGMEFCLLRAHLWAGYMRCKSWLGSNRIVEDEQDGRRNQAA